MQSVMVLQDGTDEKVRTELCKKKCVVYLVCSHFFFVLAGLLRPLSYHEQCLTEAG